MSSDTSTTPAPPPGNSHSQPTEPQNPLAPDQRHGQTPHAVPPIQTAHRVLIIPDKFKGTLAADQAARAMARGWAQARPGDEIRTLPLTDGGDGFGRCSSRILGARPRWVRTIDAAHRPCRCPWWFDPHSRIAILESALCIGLAMLPPGQFHPFNLDTQGLAAVLQAAARAQPRQCLVGIGGSATNDAGFGLARGLGWRFLDDRSTEITRWTDLPRLQTLVPPPRSNQRPVPIIVATDVRNPLLGPRGATRVYGPQKGLLPIDFAPAERCLRRLQLVARRTLNRADASLPGAGAAGGLGYGLLTFANASLQSGFDLYAQVARLNTHLEWATCVLTGEGALDASSLMGKGVGEIARLARQRHLPCLGLAGRIEDQAALRRWFVHTRALTPDYATPEEAMRHPARCLRRIARDIANHLHAHLGVLLAAKPRESYPYSTPP